VSVRVKIFIYLLIFCSFLLALLWLFQVVLLDTVYRSIKIGEVQSAMSTLTANLESDDLDEIANGIYRARGINIEILSEGGKTRYSSGQNDFLRQWESAREVLRLYILTTQNGGEYFEYPFQPDEAVSAPATDVSGAPEGASAGVAAPIGDGGGKSEGGIKSGNGGRNGGVGNNGAGGGVDGNGVGGGAAISPRSLQPAPSQYGRRQQAIFYAKLVAPNGASGAAGGSVRSDPTSAAADLTGARQSVSASVPASASADPAKAQLPASVSVSAPASAAIPGSQQQLIPGVAPSIASLGGTLVILTAIISPVNATVDTLRMELYCVTGVMLLFSVLIALLIARHVSRPIVSLRDSAKALAAGRYDVVFDATKGGYREIKDLSDTLNIAARELSTVETLRRELVANV
jgi:HAMP domain-containing protein